MKIGNLSKQISKIEQLNLVHDADGKCLQVRIYLYIASIVSITIMNGLQEIYKNVWF